VHGAHPLRTRTAGETTGVAEGALFRWLQGGKRSVCVDDEPRLREHADIVLVDIDDGLPPRPGTVTVSITDFGRGGPWAGRPASHLSMEAESGSLGSRGVPELPPVAVGGELGEWIAGLYAGVAALAAWRATAGSDAAEQVDVSVFECMLVTLNMHEPLHAALAGSDAFTRWVQVPSVERVADGWVCFSLVTGQQWLDFTAMIGRPDLGEDARLSNMLGRWPRRRVIYAAMEPWLTSRTVDEVVEAATAFRLPVAHVADGATIAGMEHFRVREVFARSPHGDYPQPRPPYRFSRLMTAGPALAPTPGADGADAARAWAVPPRPDTRARTPRRPLDGLRVVDLTAFWAGPSATGYLAALGADVVKVESVQRPDGIRFAGGQITRADGWWDYSWVFQGANAGKRGITLDLTGDAGREVLHQLLATADVLTENYSPRVMEQFGLSYDRLASAYPSLIVTRMPAFGLDGPWADRVGFALTMEALAGMATITGHPDGRPTCPGGVLDPIAGMHAVFATLVALQHRDATGEGQLVEVPMIECALNVAAEPLLEWGAHGVLLARQGNRGGADVVQDVYPCAGDDAWVAVTAHAGPQARALASVLGTEAASLKALDDALRRFAAERGAEEIVERLCAAGVPAGVVRRPTVAGRNPHLVDRGFYEQHIHPTLGPLGYPVLPSRFSTWTGPVHSRPAPTLGQHNDEVLGDVLGIGAEKLAALRSDGVVGNRPAGL
jgi:crotonobetainyl-CoA:carnitine CoA-transferase CaiB-like acyl-CoA transferase